MQAALLVILGVALGFAADLVRERFVSRRQRSDEREWRRADEAEDISRAIRSNALLDTQDSAQALLASARQLNAARRKHLGETAEWPDDRVYNPAALELDRNIRQDLIKLQPRIDDQGLTDLVGLLIATTALANSSSDQARAAAELNEAYGIIRRIHERVGELLRGGRPATVKQPPWAR